MALVALAVAFAPGGALSSDPDESTMASVQCEEAVKKRYPRSDPETTRTERDGTRYTVGGFIADGRAYVCEITDEGDGRWRLTSLRVG